jgi:predicted enzyme related to lactoylglutathione lyase
MANPSVHVELNTTDVSKAKTLYRKLFNWDLEDVATLGGGCTLVKVGGGIGGGIMEHPVPDARSAWLAYVLVDDIAGVTQKAKSLGATVIKDATEVIGAGWLGIITGGGIVQHPVLGARSAWLAYVLVDDIAAATQMSKSLAATVMKDVTEVMGAGWLSIIMDPTGAVLGLWKPKKA